MRRILADDLHKNWMTDPSYMREYDALGEEFSLVSALIAARSRAGLTQEEVARRMKTTQAVIARLEGGGSKPSTRTPSGMPRPQGPACESVLNRKRSDRKADTKKRRTCL